MTPRPLAVRIARGHPRLFTGLLCGALVFLLLSGDLAPTLRVVIGWDIAVAVYVALAMLHFSRADHTRIGADAARQEEGEWTIFGLSLAGALMSFTAIVIFAARGKGTTAHTPYVALAAATLVASWLMTQITFTYRYAHEYYAATDSGPEGGLAFPGGEAPDYLDFVYFSFVLGMTFQVSDVNILSRKMRRLATLQGVIGYLFNTVVLALAINIAAGLF
ncbi:MULTISPECIES: DUF1345 domain-containing protein [Acidiphilium]|jgi:uncharacterized membrane protein|uniref:DUF1345 domain-containing protein n=2 Tax=Acidiphilium TaxID=522 RepID=A5FVP7_ACICJ|nr:MULTISPECIES: DUF1345 domain-containing protein [Acidiphilium]MBU6355489.1 DUF1345 domain-containing protein [Rhodospirillales bacterium]ABQ29679.1 protein of unknown function DUF1345 [Acidiphilium cryptum JF-5]EGO94029.1 hypothetical protein APM_3170 [Acidiphilium sp. PM]MBS3023926.1 DUF1345 domain-containing protein [Acidiphilium multivorum]MDE2328794.1 DUF1345 domain-containing protein [Rhodospirillales bacterium]